MDVDVDVDVDDGRWTVQQMMAYRPESKGRVGNQWYEISGPGEVLYG